jgi:hypothetical protein
VSAEIGEMVAVETSHAQVLIDRARGLIARHRELTREKYIVEQDLLLCLAPMLRSRTSITAAIEVVTTLLEMEEQMERTKAAAQELETPHV